MLENISILNRPKMLIDLILIDLVTNMLSQFVPRLRVIFYTYMERMIQKFSKIKSFNPLVPDVHLRVSINKYG